MQLMLLLIMAALWCVKLTGARATEENQFSQMNIAHSHWVTLILRKENCIDRITQRKPPNDDMNPIYFSYIDRQQNAASCSTPHLYY